MCLELFNCFSKCEFGNLSLIDFDTSILWKKITDDSKVPIS